MKKIYQPIVVQEAENLIENLTESGFFKDYEIDDLTYSKERILDVLTEKYINGQLNEEEFEIFTEEEFDTLLKDLVAGSLLHQLKSKGYIESYEDDKTEEVFFLTKEGKEFLENQRKNSI